MDERQVTEKSRIPTTEKQDFLLESHGVAVEDVDGDNILGGLF